MITNQQKAEAYEIAALWHVDRSNDAAQLMEKFRPGSTSYVMAKTSRDQHMSSANGLRYAAEQLRAMS